MASTPALLTSNPSNPKPRFQSPSSSTSKLAARAIELDRSTAWPTWLTSSTMGGSAAESTVTGLKTPSPTMPEGTGVQGTDNSPVAAYKVEANSEENDEQDESDYTEDGDDEDDDGDDDGDDEEEDDEEEQESEKEGEAAQDKQKDEVPDQKPEQKPEQKSEQKSEQKPKQMPETQARTPEIREPKPQLVTSKEPTEPKQTNPKTNTPAKKHFSKQIVEFARNDLFDPATSILNITVLQRLNILALQHQLAELSSRILNAPESLLQISETLDIQLFNYCLAIRDLDFMMKSRENDSFKIVSNDPFGRKVLKSAKLIPEQMEPKGDLPM